MTIGQMVRMMNSSRVVLENLDQDIEYTKDSESGVCPLNLNELTEIKDTVQNLLSLVMTVEVG